MIKKIIGLLMVVGLSAGLLTACDPPYGEGQQIWIDDAQLMALPTSGTAWNEVLSAANSNWGLADPGDQNSTFDTKVLAGAYVARRLNDNNMATKVRNALNQARQAPWTAIAGSYAGQSRVLGYARNMASLVIAADIVGFDSQADADAFRNWLIAVRDHRFDAGHSGGFSISEVAFQSPNNWGDMSRGSLAAIDAYLGDTNHLAILRTVQERWAGAPVSYNGLQFTGTNWHGNNNPPAGVDRPGSVLFDGCGASGILPEEQRRSGEYGGGCSAGSFANESYTWEGLQGSIVAHRILVRKAGMDDHLMSDYNFRAAFWNTFQNGYAPTGDDQWQSYILNNQANSTALPENPSASEGKIMAWTQWTDGTPGVNGR